MKKLIAILIIFSVMLTLAVVEIRYTGSFYDKQENYLNILKQRFDEDPKNLNRAAVKDAFEDVKSSWEKNKDIVMVLSHHNTVKFVDEKITALEQLIRLNQESDAYTTLTTAIAYIEDLRKENLPIITNLL